MAFFALFSISSLLLYRRTLYKIHNTQNNMRWQRIQLLACMAKDNNLAYRLLLQERKLLIQDLMHIQGRTPFFPERKYQKGLTLVNVYNDLIKDSEYSYYKITLNELREIFNRK